MDATFLLSPGVVERRYVVDYYSYFIVVLHYNICHPVAKWEKNCKYVLLPEDFGPRRRYLRHGYEIRLLYNAVDHKSPRNPRALGAVVVVNNTSGAYLFTDWKRQTNISRVSGTIRWPGSGAWAPIQHTLFTFTARSPWSVVYLSVKADGLLASHLGGKTKHAILLKWHVCNLHITWSERTSSRIPFKYRISQNNTQGTPYSPRRFFSCRDTHQEHMSISCYWQTSNISRTLAWNIIFVHWDVVGASPVGAASTTTLFSTSYQALMEWADDCKAGR